MPAPEIRRTYREHTPEEHQRWLELRELVEQDMPELIREAQEDLARAKAVAMQEPTLSGQLRRAIAAKGYDRRQLADLTGFCAGDIARFMCGTSVDSELIDKLAAVLHQELRPVG
ncbi:MAG: hypothetical protein WD851_15320 [Pirellulales bacterium]